MEEINRQNVKTFAFRFSPVLIAVLALLLALCLGGIGLTTWQFIGFLQNGALSSAWEWMKYILMYLVCGLLLILVTAMLIRSRYLVTAEELILQFGIIRTKYPIGKIYSVRHFRGSGKLAVYFDDYKPEYTVVVIKEEFYDAFAKALKERNPRVDYDFTTAEEEADWKK